MDSTNSSYRPQSPDLSFLSSPTKTLQQPYSPQPPISYAPRSPDLSNFAEYASAQYMPPIPAIPPLPTSHSFGSNPQQQFYPPPHSSNNFLQTESSSTSSYNNSSYADYIPSPTMSSRGPRIKHDPSSSTNTFPSNIAQAAPMAPAYKNPNPLNIEIKTKFPVARIKRIMQADEEVGKVAQVTPIAVSKALELFMIALVGGAAEKAKEKGGKKVTAQHLKQVVLGAPEQFDFLAEIVGRVSEAQEGAGGEGRKRKEKVEKDSDSSEEEKKPKKSGRGRKKKSDD